MDDVNQDADAASASAGAAAGASSGSASRARVDDAMRTDVEVNEGCTGAGAASITSGTIVDFAPAMALANLLLSSSQSLSQSMLDMPSRSQSESIVRLATTARAAQQVLAGHLPDPQTPLAAPRSPRGCGCGGDT